MFLQYFFIKFCFYLFFLAASVTDQSFFKYHTKIHDTVKGKLATGKLTAIFPSLRQGFADGLDDIKTGLSY